MTWRDWVTAGAVFAAGILLGRLLKAGLVKAIRRGDAERAAADVVGRFVGLVVVIAALIYALASVNVRLGPLLGAVGIGGIAIAFAAQSILENFLASIILQIRRPFRRGDQIASGDQEGIVEDVNFRTVVLRTFEGERVFVPCGQVLKDPIVNHTVRGMRRTTLTVGIAYGADTAKTRQLVLETVAAVDGVRDHPPPEVWVEALAESSVDLAVRFWHAPDVATLWRVRNDVAIAVKQALDDAGVEIPFPQRVVRFP